MKAYFSIHWKQKSRMSKEKQKAFYVSTVILWLKGNTLITVAQPGLGTAPPPSLLVRQVAGGRRLPEAGNASHKPEGLGEPPRPDPRHTLVISGTCTYKPILQSRTRDGGLSGPTLPAWFLSSSSFINRHTFECIVCSELQITKLQVRRGAVRPLYFTDRMQALRSYRTECSVQAGHQGGLPGGKGWGLEGKRDTSQAYSRLCFQTGPGREPGILGSWESYEWWGWSWGWGKGGGGAGGWE